MRLVEGKTINEYMVIFGYMYRNGELWDFDPEELRDGTIEPQAVQYWLIGGRAYETNYPDID